MVFKIKKSATPNYISDWFDYPTHQYPTRSSTSGDFHVSKEHPQSINNSGADQHQIFQLADISSPTTLTLILLNMVVPDDEIKMCLMEFTVN